MKRPVIAQDEGRFLSTVQVAKAVGVSVTTIKRWVDDGILPAHRTAGGHRKLVLADVLRLTREGGLPASDLGQLVPISRAEPGDPNRFHEQLLDAVMEIDDSRIRAVIRAAYQSGIPIEVLADRVISPAMAFVGRQWQHDKLDVGSEHLVTGAVIAGLFELQGTIAANAAADRPTAVGGAPEGDHYILPSLLAKLALIEAGWDAVNIGPNTPAASFQKLLEVRRPKLLWLSVSHVADEAAFEKDFSHLFREAHSWGIPVALGGRALSQEMRSRLPYTTFGDGLVQLADFARTLCPPAQRPKRGRPPMKS
jgi:MerR family transcriptional regulator, light-induced transcriptional regulator